MTMKGDQGCCSNDNRGNRPQTKTTMASPASFPPLDPNEAKLGPKSVSAVLVVSCCLMLLSAFLTFSYNGEFFQAVAAHNNASLLLSKVFSSSQSPRQNTEAQRRKLLEMPLHNEAASMRIFGPVIDGYDNASNAGNNDISYSWYTRAQQRQFLVNHSHECWPFQSSKAGKHVGGGDSNQLVERFDQLASAPFLQTELWKYCAFYSGVGNIFWDRSQMVPAITWEDLWQHSGSEQYTALIVTPPATSTATTKSSFATAASASSWIHPSFLRLDSTKAKQLSQTMIRLLMETEDTLLTSSNALYFYQALAQHIQSDKAWSTWDAQCQVPSPQNPTDQVLVKRHSNNKKTKTVAVSRQRHLEIDNDATPPKFSSLPTYGLHCTMLGGYCCQVWKDDLPEMPVMILQHPFGTTGGTSSAVVSTSTQQTHRYLPSSDEDMSMYWSTITAVPTADANKAVSKLETPNFFDILLQNNCLPTSEECHRCLKRYTSTTGCDDQCRQDCPCYCKVLCQIRPPSKHIKAVWYVSPPLYQPQRPLPPRLIPRIIHQTWYEPLEKDKYPNMSRLQQSWKQSGWKHVFYDDATAAKFLQEHFPPEVLEAYHAIQPGAFKADLFRYCVLLIQGGVYADMDVLLETNLEEAIAPNVGFMTPMDEPGIKVDHQACLWNGFMAVAPGHPFVAKTIELVVNNIRNRFTSVDYDDMLCPNPILSSSHLFDILFTTGPCILGTAMNIVLNRHPQTGFKRGEIDIWGADGQSHQEQPQRQKGALKSPPAMVEPDDPRMAIPGRSIILRQNKNDMGAHRFTFEEKNLVVCSTDMPDYDDRPKKPHYAESGKQTSLYGTTQLYSDFSAANEEIKVVVVGNPNNYTL